MLIEKKLGFFHWNSPPRPLNGLKLTFLKHILKPLLWYYLMSFFQSTKFTRFFMPRPQLLKADPFCRRGGGKKRCFLTLPFRSHFCYYYFFHFFICGYFSLDENWRSSDYANFVTLVLIVESDSFRWHRLYKNSGAPKD